MATKSKSKVAPANKAATKKAATKKVAVKTAAVKTAAAKKAAAKKAPAKKAAVAKQAWAKKVAAKKAIIRKTATKKAPPVRKVAATKAPARKAALKKAPTRKLVAKKVAPPRKAPARRAAALGYDPLLQLDKLSEPTTVGRGLEAAPAVDVNAVLGEFFSLRHDEPLTNELAAAAAADLGVEVAALRAIAQVESAGAGFDAKGRPTILYERHVFGRNTNPKGKFNAQYADISAAAPYAKGTFGNTEAQWVKLARAFQLDPDAALKAPSWGTFQILGENHRAAGFADVRSFVTEMFRSPAGHLRALVGFIKANPAIHRGLKNRDWVAVALGYNGKGYKTYDYDNKLAAAYAKFAAV